MEGIEEMVRSQHAAKVDRYEEMRKAGSVEAMFTAFAGIETLEELMKRAGIDFEASGKSRI